MTLLFEYLTINIKDFHYFFNTFPPNFQIITAYVGNDRYLGGDKLMARLKKNPSKAGVSAASVKGNAGPTVERAGGGKRTSQNQQYKQHNMGDE